MKPRFPLFVVVAAIATCAGSSGVWAQVSAVPAKPTAPAPAAQSTPAPHISRQTRMDLEKLFVADLVYIRSSFPMGKRGLTLKDGVTTPNGDELRQDLAIWGPSVKPGDQARISTVTFKDNFIRFEVNGGPIKRAKWYNHISISGAGGTAQVPPSDSQSNPRGTFVDLVFDRYVPEMTPEQLRQLLWPVFDFKSKTAMEAYLETIPPKAAQAIKDHKVLVGMDREMVLAAKGRPEHKEREKEGEVEHEEWVYGTPPEDVEFVRLIGDEVVQIETMKVDGTKIVRVDREFDAKPKPTVVAASQTGQPGAPSLRRPGEVSPDAQAGPSTPGHMPTGEDMPPGDSGPNGTPGGMPTGPGGGPVGPSPTPYSASAGAAQPVGELARSVGGPRF